MIEREDKPATEATPAWVAAETEKLKQPADTAAPTEGKDTPVEADDADDADDLLESADDGKNRGKTVSHKALHRERENRKRAEAERDKEREQFARAQERLSLIQQAWEEDQRAKAAPQQQAQTEQQDAEPDKQADPIGWFEWRDRRHAQEVAELKAALQQDKGATQQQQAIQQLHSAYVSSAQQFKQKQPDFQDAYSYLWKELDQDLQDRGISDAARRKQILQGDEFSFAAEQLQGGRNPAEVIYTWAKRRGYKGAETQQAPQEKQPAVAQIEQQNRRNEAAKSLSEPGGKAPSNGLSLKDIADMDKDEFIQATSGKNWEKLMRQASR